MCVLRMAEDAVPLPGRERDDLSKAEESHVADDLTRCGGFRIESCCQRSLPSHHAEKKLDCVQRMSYILTGKKKFEYIGLKPRLFPDFPFQTLHCMFAKVQAAAGR